MPNEKVVCPVCKKKMLVNGTSITNNLKQNKEYKEYSKKIYYCGTDDVWISVEIPRNKDK